ncbi:hypothetical protein [Stenotrophomonas maltophilia]|uniref:hypothetical protein n=1 Tax=Stenotrophomonas maltophilia TaxID=40324 RepID=UPI000C15890F|nr:hypothetical protein [Stenotrophomonas maltophilia]
MPDVKLSQLVGASPASAEAGAALWTMAGHILGLRMEYVGPASLRVSSGSAWILSLKRAIEIPSAITLSGLSLVADTWYHLYLYLNGATPAIELVATAPAAAYSGSARAKSGDTSRRYIGSVKTLPASAALIPFIVDSLGEQRWLISNPSLPLRCLSNGKQTARTSVSLAPAMPVTATHAILQVSNTASDYYCNLSVPGAVMDSIIGVPPGGSASSNLITFPTSANQQVDYIYGATPNGGLYIDVVGFACER